MTQWEHFKANYIKVSVFMILIFILALSFEIVRNSEDWWFSFFFLFLGVVVLPIGNYFSWKKKKL